MKGILLTAPGMEDLAAREVEQLIGQKGAIDEGCVSFPCNGDEDLFRLCYRCQSASKIGFLALDFPYSDLVHDFEQAVDRVPWSAFFMENEPIQVRCKFFGHKNLPSHEYERQLSAILLKHLEVKNKNKQPVDLKDPNVTVIFYMASRLCYVFVDYAGFDLSKRTHHVFSHAADIKGTLAFGLIQLSDMKPGDVFLDCFAGSGTIPIEAALHATNFPVNYFNKEKFAFLRFERYKAQDFTSFFEKEDKKIIELRGKIHCIDSSMSHITSAKKNAQVAGVHKDLDFSRMELEWLDTKLDRESVDVMVSKLPLGREGHEKHYAQFFHQAEFILKKHGSLVLMGLKDLIEKHAKDYGLAIREHRIIICGKEIYDVFTIEKIHKYKSKDEKQDKSMISRET